MLKTLTISGLRGFATAQTLNFAVPNAKAGSGLTVIVGPNNGGKSTIIEAIRAISQHQVPSFSKGKRNIHTNGIVQIRATTLNGVFQGVQTIQDGGSECELTGTRTEKILVLPSRRFFQPFFGKGESPSRDQYRLVDVLQPVRQPVGSNFAPRLIRAFRRKAEFNKVLSRLVSPPPLWKIEQDDSGQHFIEVSAGPHLHNSEGIGEGLLSLLFIVDALYDSTPEDCIVIDEPELSLHPALQRRLLPLFQEYAKDRQITISTHSPYFTDFETLVNNGTISRVFKREDSCQIRQISDETKAKLAGLLKDQNNPHVLGLNAREVFFLEDRIILVEGQEDVVFFPEVCRQVGVELKGEFFGWGVGGAEKMHLICSLLKELGFERVAGILDGNKASTKTALEAAFPDYRFFVLPLDDIRTKPPVLEKPTVQGVLLNGQVRPDFKDAVAALLSSVNSYLQ